MGVDPGGLVFILSAALMADQENTTGSKPASRENPLLYTFLGICKPCNAVWVVGSLLSAHHALVATRLHWLCPDCNRALSVEAMPKPRQPEAKPC